MKKNVFAKILCCTIATMGILSAGVIADITFNTSNIISVYANSDLVVTKISESEAIYYNSGLTPVEQNGKWGFKDASGNVAIACTYDIVKPFSEGLACVTKDGKTGFIDNTGAVVIPLMYGYDTGSFSNGYASVDLGAPDGMEMRVITNYIDKNNKKLLAIDIDSGMEYVSNFPYGDGLIATSAGFNPGSYLDSNGNDTGVYYGWYSEDESSERYYSEGLQAKSLEKGDSIPNPKTGPMSSSSNLSEMLSNPVMGYVDKNDKVVISFDYEEAKNFHDGYAPVKKNGKWGYIDKSNNVVVDFQFDTADKLNEGVAFATKGNEYFKITLGETGTTATTGTTGTTATGSTTTAYDYGTLNFGFTSASEYTDLGHLPATSNTSWGKSEKYNYILRTGMLVGSDGKFNPDSYLTREEVVYALYKHVMSGAIGDFAGVNRGANNFQDIANSPYKEAIDWCYSTGVVSGMNSTEFRPTSLINMEQLAVMLANYIDAMNFNWKGVDISDVNAHFSEYGHYNDRNKVSSWAIEEVDLSVVWPYLFTDDNNNFNPQSNITRDTFIVYVMELLHPVS